MKVAQSCPALCDTMDCTVHGILQARILECVAFPFSRGSSWPRDQTRVSCITGRFFTNWAIRVLNINYIRKVSFNILLQAAISSLGPLNTLMLNEITQVPQTGLFLLFSKWSLHNSDTFDFWSERLIYWFLLMVYPIEKSILYY